MLQYKKYNIRSPLNAVAAEWANANAQSLPLAQINLGEAAVPVDIVLGRVIATEG